MKGYLHLDSNVIYPQYDRKRGVLTLPSYTSIMKFIKYAIATRHSTEVAEYNRRLVEALCYMLDEETLHLLNRVVGRIPSERILMHAKYNPVLSRAEADSCIIKSAADSMRIAKEDMQLLDSL